MEGNQDIDIAGGCSFPPCGGAKDSQRFYAETLEFGQVSLNELESLIEFHGNLTGNYCR